MVGARGIFAVAGQDGIQSARHSVDGQNHDTQPLRAGLRSHHGGQIDMENPSQHNRHAVDSDVCAGAFPDRMEQSGAPDIRRSGYPGDAPL